MIDGGTTRGRAETSYNPQHPYCPLPLPCSSITPSAAMASRCRNSAAFLMYSRAFTASGETEIP